MSEKYTEIRQASLYKRMLFLLKDSVLYGGASSLSKFFYILLLPLLTNLMTKEEFGIYDTLMVVSNFVLVLIVFGTDSSLARFFYETKDKEEQIELVSQTLLYELLASIFVAVILFLSSDHILKFYFGVNDYKWEFTILIISIPFIIIVRFTQNILKWVFFRKEFLIVSAGSVIVTLILSIASVSILGAEIQFLFYSQLISMLGFSFLGLYYCRNYIRPIYRLSTLPAQLKFGAPFAINVLVIALLPILDRYLISNFLGIAFLGLYAVGSKIAGLSQFAISGFQVAWGPFAYSIMNEEKQNETYIKVFNYYLLFIVVFSTTFSFLIPVFINLLATSEYSSTGLIILLLLYSKLISSISGITAIGLELSKKTIHNLTASIVLLVSTAILMFAFINLFGIDGVALSILLGNVIYVMFINFMAFKVSGIDFPHFKAIKYLLFAIIGNLLLLLTPSLGLKLLIYLSMVTLLLIYFYRRFMDKGEMLRIQKLFDGLLKRKY